MDQYIVLLSDLSHELGLIGFAEYRERREIADWLSPAGNKLPDPRDPRSEGQEITHEACENQESEGAQPHKGPSTDNSTEEDPLGQPLHFVALNKWMFTIGDNDCYPSVPHGHLKKKTRSWPKLNPYTGRVFSGAHLEDVGVRLTKDEMKTLWRDGGFVEHCRRQVHWYSSFAPEYEFSNARFGKFRFPRW